LQTSNQRAVSRTLRVSPPVVTVRLPYSTRGPRGMRPNVAFSPTRPLKPAGMRIDPPPSPPVPSVKSPPATAAPVPPDEPPGVCAVFHGLRVTPFSTVRVMLTPPNSLDVVSPKWFAPATCVRRSTIVEVQPDTRSASGTEASVAGQPSTWSSSFTPSGTPPNGLDTSAAAARARAPSSSTNDTAFRLLALTAASVAFISSTGDRLPARNSSTREHASPNHGASPMGAS